MKSSRVKITNLTDQIGDALAARIASGEFGPGAQLPSADALCVEFGVSRTVVREAISRLKSEGLVVSRQGAGVFVAHDKLGIPFRIAVDRADAPAATLDVLELRLGVESEAAAFAAERASRKQLQAIKSALDAMREAFARGEDGVDEDVRFHRAIAEASNNALYLELSEFLERHARHQMMSGGKSARVGRSMEARAEHEEIYRAVVARDPDAARAAARNHFRKSIDRLERSRTH